MNRERVNAPHLHPDGAVRSVNCPECGTHLQWTDNVWRTHGPVKHYEVLHPGVAVPLDILRLIPST